VLAVVRLSCYRQKIIPVHREREVSRSHLFSVGLPSGFGRCDLFSRTGKLASTKPGIRQELFWDVAQGQLAICHLDFVLNGKAPAACGLGAVRPSP
jgi:hypothetical protein